MRKETARRYVRDERDECGVGMNGIRGMIGMSGLRGLIIDDRYERNEKDEIR